jgi:hypothetical protein
LKPIVIATTTKFHVHLRHEPRHRKSRVRASRLLSGGGRRRASWRRAGGLFRGRYFFFYLPPCGGGRRAKLAGSGGSFVARIKITPLPSPPPLGGRESGESSRRFNRTTPAGSGRHGRT